MVRTAIIENIPNNEQVTRLRMITLDLSHKKQRFDDAVLAATCLEHFRLTTERELQDLKWFGYRFMTPLSATELFYDTYHRLRVDYVREHKDRDLAEKLVKVPFSTYAEDKAKLAKAWSARQAADTFGMPYDLYIEFGLWFWSRRGGGGRSNVPQINQLGYTDASEVAWRAGFEKFASDDRIWMACRSLADVPQLHPGAFDGTAEQVAARRFIADLCVRSERSWSSIIEMWCNTYPVMTPEAFATVVSLDVLEETLAIGATTAPAPASMTTMLLPGSLWPSCHGMPNAMDTEVATCRDCTSSASCDRLASLVKSKVLESTGFEEPRRKELRKSENERMRRLRAKQKAASASASIAAASHVPEVTLS